MATKANLPGKHTNHSGRKSMVTNQLQKKVPPIHVAKLSGHKNLMSVNDYNTLDIDQQFEMSDNSHGLMKRATPTTNIDVQDQTAISTSFDEMSDDDLVLASQEIEQGLNMIEQIYQVRL